MSKREDIVTSIVSTLEGLSAFNHVERKLPTYEELQQFSEAQFPVVCVVAGLPVPVEKLSGRSNHGTVDLIISTLDVELYVYILDNENADSTISSKLETLWIALLEDESQGGLTLGTILRPDRDIGFWHPYAAFRVTVSMTYQHTKGGI